jgi:hypothetical protein
VLAISCFDGGLVCACTATPQEARATPSYHIDIVKESSNAMQCHGKASVGRRHRGTLPGPAGGLLGWDGAGQQVNANMKGQEGMVCANSNACVPDSRMTMVAPFRQTEKSASTGHKSSSAASSTSTRCGPDSGKGVQFCPTTLLPSSNASLLASLLCPGGTGPG